MRWIGDKIGAAFAGILIALDTIIYYLITGAYRIFISLAGAELLTGDAYEMIAQKIYIVIGVAMLFVLAYAILKGIIDPDKMGKEGAGGPKMLKSVVIAVLGLALTPVFFNLLYQAQGIIINHNLIGNIFSGISISSEESKTTSPVSETITNGENSITVNIDSVNKDEQLNKMGGAMVSTTIWSAFFHPSYVDPNTNDYNANMVVANKVNGIVNMIGGGACGVAAAVLIPVGFPLSLLAAGAAGSFCSTQLNNIQEAAGVVNNRYVTLAEAYAMTSSGENFAVYSSFIDNVGSEIDECKEGQKTQCGSVEYSFFVSTVVGVFVLYCFASFSIDMGKRAGMLAFYQLIAPVPLIMQIIPKYKDSLKKYMQSVFSTFMNVFVCIFVVYMVVYLAGHVTEMFTDKDLFPYLGAGWKAIALVFLIIGLIIFAKAVPKMISDTFGIKEGSLKLGIGEKLKQGEVYTALGIGSSMARSAAQQAQEGWSRTTAPNGNTYSRGERIFNAINGGLRGAASGGYRSAQKRFKDHKPVDSYQAASEMNRTVSEAVNNATQERLKNQRDIYSRTNKDGSARTGAEAVFKGHLENARDKVLKWGTATVDTSYDDTTLSTYGTMVENRDALRTKTGKVEQTRFVENLVNNLNTETVKEFDEAGYNAAIDAATRSVIRAAGESDDHYYQRVKAAQDAVDRTKFENKNFIEDSAKLQRRKNAMSKLLESVQDLDYMGLAAIKGDAAAKDALQAQITAQIKNLGDRANEKVKWKDKTDPTAPEVEITLKEMMEREYGVDVKTGQINWTTLKNNTLARSAIEIVDGNGDSHVLKASINATTGTIDGFVDDSNFFGKGTGHVFSLNDIADMANNQDPNDKLKQIQNISALSSINNATDSFKAAKQKLASSAEYLSAKARQREQNNRNNNH